MRWTILVYHNVSWEDSPFTRGIGGMTCPPDVFRDHLQVLQRLGEIVGVQEGIERLREGGRGRLFTLWFDDGLTGVRRYAFPILQSMGIRACVSVCSRFSQKRELYWRFKLSYLRFTGGIPRLRSRLRAFGYKGHRSVKDFMLDHFSPALLDVLEEVFRAVGNGEALQAGLQLFESPEGLAELHRAGWSVGNHSAAHWPLGEDSAIDYFEEHYEECERFLKDILNEASPFAVLPFDRATRRSDRLFDTFEKWNEKNGGDRYLVLLGNRSNRSNGAFERRILYRFTAPVGDGKTLKRAIRML